MIRWKSCQTIPLICKITQFRKKITQGHFIFKLTQLTNKVTLVKIHLSHSKSHRSQFKFKFGLISIESKPFRSGFITTRSLVKSQSGVKSECHRGVRQMGSMSELKR